MGREWNGKIGQAMIQIGAMTKTQVDQVLQLQSQGDSRKFGDIAISLEYCCTETINNYLKKNTTSDDKGSYHQYIGDAMVKGGIMNPGQVEEILSLQKAGDKRLFGQIALEKKYVQMDALSAYLESLTKAKHN